MAITNDITEELALLDTHWPQTRQAATHVGAWVLAATYPRYLLKLKVGAMGSGGVVNAKFQQATSAAGAGVKDVDGKAITPLTQAGSDENSVVGINLRTEELDVSGGFKYIRFAVTITVADCLYDAELLATGGRFIPVSVTNWDEVIS